MGAIALGVTTLIPQGAVRAESRDYGYTGACSIRVSGFQDWGKAAASTRDINACGSINVRLYYGTLVNNWSSTKGPTFENYVKTNAGYYDWHEAFGKPTGWDWRGFCNRVEWC